MTPRRRILPIFVPHAGCPNDCVFCNQKRISGSLLPASAETVRDAVSVLEPGSGYELAFYGGSFTAIPEAEQDARADAHGVLHSMCPVLPCLPEIIERRVTEDDRRVNAHAVRAKRGNGARCFDIPRVIAAGKSCHHLQNEREARIFHKLSRLYGILARMTAPAAEQHLVAHGLRAELHGLHAVKSQTRQFFFRYGVRPC